MDDWLTTAETSALTRVAEGTLRYYKHIGSGPRCYKVGRRLLYKRSDVLTWMESQAVEPRTAAS
ncbi:helix-turn-helix domain-containing protein [Kineococcus endophyticus]|uniref:Helix-turn-helix domain-containing protein n=1 Tax=Kineococcus endophyticus TaxID=1181883 RepID=A0ABV3P143_9ACTN